MMTAFWRYLRRDLDFKRLAEPGERASSESGRQAQQTKKHLRRDEGVAAGGVSIVRNDGKQLTQGIQGEVSNRWTAGKGAVALEMQCQIHRVEASVRQLEAPVAAIRGIEGCDVVADVVTNDHAVAEILEELF